MDFLLKSLLDLLVALVLARWFESRERPELRLETGGGPPPGQRRPKPIKTSVVAVLVSQRGMMGQLRWVLGERTSLRFVTTWAELQEVVTQVSPTAIFADPLADTAGDPRGHLARFAQEWHLPVVLYTVLTPECAAKLLALGRLGIRHVIFHRFDDNPERLRAVLDWELDGGPPPRPQAA